MSSDIVRFVDSLVATLPGLPRSIQLDIDVGGDTCAMFEVLLLIMTDILKRWYAPPITIGSITDEDLLRLIQYFASFGIRFGLEVQDVPQVLSIRNQEYLTQTRLDRMKFQMTHANKLYTVRFSNLPTA